MYRQRPVEVIHLHTRCHHRMMTKRGRHSSGAMRPLYRLEKQELRDAERRSHDTDTCSAGGSPLPRLAAAISRPRGPLATSGPRPMRPLHEHCSSQPSSCAGEGQRESRRPAGVCVGVPSHERGRRPSEGRRMSMVLMLAWQSSGSDLFDAAREQCVWCACAQHKRRAADERAEHELEHEAH